MGYKEFTPFTENSILQHMYCVKTEIAERFLCPSQEARIVEIKIFSSVVLSLNGFLV
jgi:23S rRNA A1618 N6-methylase RlmF